MPRKKKTGIKPIVGIGASAGGLVAFDRKWIYTRDLATSAYTL